MLKTIVPQGETASSRAQKLVRDYTERMQSRQTSNIKIAKHVASAFLAAAIAMSSVCIASSQGLKGVRGFGWPSPSELEDCEIMVSLNPKSYAASEELAEMYFYRGDGEKAIALLRKAVKLRLASHVAYSDPEGLANAYSWLGWHLVEVKDYPEAENALIHSLNWWKRSMISDTTGNSKWRVELDLERLTLCYAEWGRADMARKTYAQLLAQMEVPNDCHNNLADLNSKLRQLGILPQPACPKLKAR